ncbi:MAG: DUF2225 domain-containing protein [Peptococcaceae bacterium]|nr:DUF2225 domain-containing protein [Peptococcaceae bacterium]
MSDGTDQIPEQVRGMGQGDYPPPEKSQLDEGSQLEVLYDKKFVCPLCQAAFTSKKIRSRYVKPIRIETDFCQVFSPGDPNPLHYFVIICPKCSYGFFEDSSRIPAHVRGQVEKVVGDWRLSHTKSFCQERTLFDVIAAYLLALTLADIIHENHINRAGLNIRLAWLFRAQKDSMREETYLKEALRHYEQSYIHGDFAPSNTSEMQLLYMTGELHRRFKNYREAIRCFSMVVHHEDKSRYRKFVTLARDQWTLAREEHKQENDGKTDLTEVAKPH